MRIIRAFFLCLACIANMALPADAMPGRNTDDETIQVHDSDTDGYRLNFALSGPNASILKLAVNRPDGSPVNDAQVVIALIDRQGRQYLTRAAANADGYQVSAAHSSWDIYRIEAEVITGGQLLTDHFHVIQPS